MIKFQHGIITQAAKELNVSRPTIYRGIQNKRIDILQKLYDLQTKYDKKMTLANKLYTHLQSVCKN